MTMQYYKELQQKKKQEKYGRWQQNRIAQANQNMRITQILCRTLRYCKNSDTKLCMQCRWNKASPIPNGDYYTPRIPGLKVLP